MIKSKSKKKKIKKQLRLKGINGKIKPTAQDVRIAKELVKPGVKKGEALIAAGIPPLSARSNSAEIIARPGVQAALVMAMEEAGVTTQRIAGCVNDGLSATKIVSVNLLVLDKDELPRKDGFVDATKDEPLIERAFVRVEDYAVRHSYVRTAAELLDLFPAKEQAPGSPDLPPSEEKNLIEQAEKAAGSRDISRYTVIREQR